MTYDSQWEEASFQTWAMRLARQCKRDGRDQTARLSRFFDQYRSGFDALIATPRLQRLAGRRQFGERRLRVEDFGASLIARPFPHTRLTHVQQAAAHALVAGVILGLDTTSLKTLACAALLHDVDHPAFSHTGDRWLVRVLGLPDHEARACETVCTDVHIGRALQQLDVLPQDVAVVIREEGILGRILSLVDTLAYVQLDGRILGIVRSRNLRLGIDVLSNFVAVHATGYEVRQMAPMQDVLNLRLQLFNDLYDNVTSRISVAVAETLLDYAYKHGMITEEDVRVLSCGAIEQRLRTELSGRAGWLESAMDILFCGWAEDGPWRLAVMDTEEELTGLLADNPRAFVSRPSSNRAKSYACWYPGDVHRVLQARGQIASSRSKILVVIYKGV